MSSNRAFSVLVAISLLLASEGQATEKLLAVLPLDVSHAKNKMDVDARVSLEEMLRDGAADALASEGWTVMTGETTLQLLSDNGIDPAKCGDTSCHLTAARELTASKFISGSIQWVDLEFVASIRLIDTSSGRILSSARLEGATTKALRNEFEGKAPEFFAKSGLFEDGGVGKRPPGKANLKVASEPPGATVRLDGELLGQTPLSHHVEEGTYYVTIESNGFAPVTRQIAVERGHETAVFERLSKVVGYLDVTVVPATARVFVDGAPAASGKQGPFPIGKHIVRVEAAGHAVIEQAIEIENGVTVPLTIELQRLPGKLLIQTNVDADCEAGGARARTTASSVTILVVPSGLVRLTCRREGYAPAMQDATVEAGKALAVTLVLAKDVRRYAGQTRAEAKSALEFIFLPGGAFHAGCEPADARCSADEIPGHAATVAPFWLGKTEVPMSAFALCVNAGICTPPSETPDTCNAGRRGGHPANCLDWDQARQFCTWIGGRLPTADEWEFAAKSGESRIFPWGDAPLTGERANYCDANCAKATPEAASWADLSQDDHWPSTAPVGSYPKGASKWGLLDLAGNVWEWTASDYDQSNKEIRGGGWYDARSRLRASHRLATPLATRAYNLGFRCLQEK
jgi:formylglycine-generating enzyme required for sulfatase activity